MHVRLRVFLGLRPLTMVAKCLSAAFELGLWTVGVRIAMPLVGAGKEQVHRIGPLCGKSDKEQYYAR